MGLIRIPPPELVLARIHPLDLVVCQGIDAAVQDAYRVFHQERHNFDPNMHAGWVRTVIKEYLDAHGHEAEYDRQELPFCGLHIRHPMGNFKILKSSYSGIPAPKSQARKQYLNYNQRGPWQFSLWTSPYSKDPYEAPPDVDFDLPLNYVFHWQISPQWRLINVTLSLPRLASTRSVSTYWDHALAHPATVIAGSPSSVPSDDQPYDIPNVHLRVPMPTGTEQEV